MDRLFNQVAVDIVRLSVLQVPQKTSGLMNSKESSPVKLGFMRYRIQYNKKYAAYQERGMARDGSRVVRNYSKSGTKSHYLEDPAKLKTKDLKSLIRAELNGVRV